MNVIKKSFDLGDGRIVEIETGKLAKQADGSVVIPKVLVPYMGGVEVIKAAK